MPNPSIRIGFEMDYSKTTTLCYGFQSGSFDPDSGWMGRGFSIPEEFRSDYDRPKYLIAVGEDIGEMEVTCYATGGWDTEKQGEGGVSIERYETDLETALRDIAVCMFKDTRNWESNSLTDGDFELYFALLKEWLTRYGLLSDDVLERYEYGMIGDSDFAVVERVFYMVQTVTVPAGGGVRVTAELTKEASFDYHCAHTENRGISGYDAVTTLGSNLNFVSQEAVLEDREQIILVRQNFGFAPDEGVNEVELDLSVPHYYLEVRRKES